MRDCIKMSHCSNAQSYRLCFRYLAEMSSLLSKWQRQWWWRRDGVCWCRTASDICRREGLELELHWACSTDHRHCCEYDVDHVGMVLNKTICCQSSAGHVDMSSKRLSCMIGLLVCTFFSSSDSIVASPGVCSVVLGLLFGVQLKRWGLILKNCNCV